MCAKEIQGPMDLKIYPSKKSATVTRQLTKSIDFRQNYLWDFHLWKKVDIFCLSKPHLKSSTIAFSLSPT
jgi:hypothetical protein